MVENWLNQVAHLSLWQSWFLIGLNVFLVVMLVVGSLDDDDA